MAYATPADYVQAFGIEEARLRLLDEERALTAEAFAAGLEAIEKGEPVTDEVAARALARLTRKLDNASNYMDGYIGNAATLPLTGIAQGMIGALQECCLALTRCAISDDTDNATERMDKRCDTWRTWLKDVAAGKVKLVDAAGDVPAGGGGKVLIGSAPSAYNWDAHAAFGGGYRP